VRTRRHYRTGYRVDIDGRVYEGGWNSPANAVFGAMRKDEIDGYREEPRRHPARKILIGVEYVDDRPIVQKVHRVLEK
jgi:hypothetical protein